MRKAYTSLDAFLNTWNDADRKQAIIEEISSRGVFLDELAEQVGLGFDAFDLICNPNDKYMTGLLPVSKTPR